MKRMFKFIFISALLVSLSLSTACKPWTIVKNEKTEDDGSVQIYFASDDFDADSFAADIWENRLLDYYQERSVEATELIGLLKEDEALAGESYGIGSNDIGSEWQFVINGKGKVLEVNSESRAGTMSIDLEPYDGTKDITIQIGPVIKGSSIRDTLDFIKLDDFENQVEFASISKAFNGLIIEKVVAQLDLTESVGREIEFLGSFTYEGVDDILLSPVSISGLESE